MRKPYQSPDQDEKLILLYCPGRGLNSRPPAHRASNMAKVPLTKICQWYTIQYHSIPFNTIQYH